MRTWLSILILVLLTACSAPVATQIATPADQPAAQPRPTLRIYNWDTYIDPALISRFEAENNITIDYHTYSSNEELLANVKKNSGSYDLVVISDFMVAQLRRQGLLIPLNKTNLPNLENLDSLFVSPAFDPDNRYCAPYLWGTLGIGYNQAAVGASISSWAELFDPAYAGRVALLDDARYTLGMVLLYLGYSPNTTDPAEIEAARDFLIARQSQISAYVPDNGQDLLAEGKADLAYEWSGDIFQVMAQRPELAYSIPDEGSIIWTDSMCILQGSPNQALAERFMNYILDPDVGATLANYTHYSTPNRAALSRIDQTDRNNPALYPTEQLRRRLFFLVDVGGDAAGLYAAAWHDVTSH